MSRSSEPRTCVICGKPLRGNRRNYCGPGRMLYQTEDGAIYSGWKLLGIPRPCWAEAERRAAVERRSARRVWIRCAGCGEFFVPRRSDARTCSNACRQRAYRKRYGSWKGTDNTVANRNGDAVCGSADRGTP